jgi:hypothetical protein
MYGAVIDGISLVRNYQAQFVQVMRDVSYKPRRSFQKALNEASRMTRKQDSAGISHDKWGSAFIHLPRAKLSRRPVLPFANGIVTR